MSITIKNNKDVYIYQGDSGILTINVSNLTPSTTYSVYFQINTTTPTVKTVSLTTSSSGSGSININFTVAETKLLTVGKYQYALKVCASGLEDTLTPAPCEQAGLFVVCAQVIEGA